MSKSFAQEIGPTYKISFWKWYNSKKSDPKTYGQNRTDFLKNLETALKDFRAAQKLNPDADMDKDQDSEENKDLEKDIPRFDFKLPPANQRQPFQGMKV
ncbi:MAG: hypothetical protein WCG27_10360 [Pseudomonadota bacterium]